MIDLIIPAYNAEDTIARALGSVVAQTKPRKFIVTVVDDCSTDATAAIVQKFKGLIPLKYIKLEKNLGRPGLVRQVGVDNTSCPYIMFLDADDLLEPTAGEYMSRAIMQNNPDFIIGGFLTETTAEKEEEAKYKFYNDKCMTWLHGNVYGREFLSNNNIKFDDRFNEDGSFNLKCLLLANNIKYINKNISYWMVNKKSITRSNDNFMLDISEDYIDTYSDAIEFITYKKPEIVNNQKFQVRVGHKLAEFLEIYDANLYHKQPEEKILKLFTKIKNFVTILKRHSCLTKDMLLACNCGVNNYQIFPDIIRQINLLGLYEKLGINYDEVMK